MNEGKEVLHDRDLLNHVWHKKGLPLAKHKLGGVYSFLIGNRFKTKQRIYFTQCRVMDLLAAGYALVSAKSLWLQKRTGEMHRRNIPWELWSSPPTPQICKLKTTESWKSKLKAFPKLWKYHDAFALLLYSSTETGSWVGESWPLPHRALCSTFIQHHKLEIHREIYFYKSSYKTRSSVDLWLSLLVVRLICRNPIALSPVTAIIFR